MTMYKDITNFHQKFGLEYHGRPRDLPDDLFWFRNGFLDEEMKEYLRAWQEQNLEKQFDALIDIVYVAMGTAYLHGFNFEEGWKRVHEANMNKVRATDADESERGSTFDVVKPEGWEPPVLKDLMTMHQGPDGVYTIVGVD